MLLFQIRDGDLWANCATTMDIQRRIVSAVTGKLGDFRLIVTDDDEWFELAHTPGEFRLFQNAPNPFNPGTFISYEIPGECRIQLIIYNIIGQPVRTYQFEHFFASAQTVWWDGRDDRGNVLSSGIYLCQLIGGGKTQTIKMLLNK